MEHLRFSEWVMGSTLIQYPCAYLSFDLNITQDYINYMNANTTLEGFKVKGGNK